MWLVILGHCIQIVDVNFAENPLFKVIYLFHMPLFFLISGYFARPRILRQKVNFLFLSCRRLLMPILTIGTINLILIFYKNNVSVRAFFDAYFILWFIWVLLECHIFGCLLLLCTNTVMKIVLLFTPLILSVIYPSSIPFGGFFSSAWAFYLIGTYMQLKTVDSSHFKITLLMLIPVACVCFYFFKPHWYMYYTPLSMCLESWGIWLFRTLTALICIPIFLSLVALLPNFKWLTHMGTATLGIYVIQSCVMVVVIRTIGIVVCQSIWIVVFMSVILYIVFYFTYKCTRIIPLVARIVYGEKQASITDDK